MGRLPRKSIRPKRAAKTPVTKPAPISRSEARAQKVSCDDGSRKWGKRAQTGNGMGNETSIGWIGGPAIAALAGTGILSWVIEFSALLEIGLPVRNRKSGSLHHYRTRRLKKSQKS